jgi:transposase-like protein
VRESLYTTVVHAGLMFVLEVLEGEREAVCGPRYRHDAERTAHRAGSVESSLVMGGRKVGVKRPRARTEAGEEVELPSWSAWSREDPLDERAVEQMVVGVSTRRYARSLEAVPAELEERGTSKSAVSRRFVQGTERKLAELMARDLSGLDLVALYLDGVHFKAHTVVVAMGVDSSGAKHVLGLCEGATENRATCTALLEGLVERGLKTERALLVVIDGSKALASAVRAVLGKRALIQRCQVHKTRNVVDALPKGKQETVRQALRQAYRTADATRAQRMLENLARQLEVEHPGAAGAVREGLEETLTVKRLGLTGALERTFSTTNAIENLIGQARTASGRVKRWRGGAMILRWCAAGVLEAEGHFHRVKGKKDVPALVAALRRHDAEIDSLAALQSAVTAA